MPTPTVSLGGLRLQFLTDIMGSNPAARKDELPETVLDRLSRSIVALPRGIRATIR